MKNYYLRSIVFHFSRARFEDINQYIIPIIKKQQGSLVIHVGSNDARTNISNKIADNLLMLKSSISKQLASCSIVLSKPIIPHNNGKETSRCVMLINICQLYNQNASKKISSQHLGQEVLDLNAKDKDGLALDFLKQIQKF